MALVVMKFGGTSVADTERIETVARHVKREVDAGNQVAVIVSAMAGTTNQLVEWVREISPLYDAREYDSIVASGEQITAGLLAVALQTMGVTARSWQGWQIPIHTDETHGAARIAHIDGARLRARLGQGEVAVVTGFQGVEPEHNRNRQPGTGKHQAQEVGLLHRSQGFCKRIQDMTPEDYGAREEGILIRNGRSLHLPESESRSASRTTA